MSGIQYYSKEGLKKLEDQLRYLKTTRRQEVANAIAEAREKGDLKENAEYDAAKEEQGKLENEIANLEQVLVNARVIDESQMDTSKAHVLSTVKILNKKVNKEFQYTLVSANEANVKEGKISIDSPIGQALLGREVGESVAVDVPAGRVELEILAISR